MLNAGVTIRDYRILSKLGEGGMGSVYLAEDINLERKVAVKILNALLTEDSKFIERFCQEARVQASLLHPNIVSLYNFFKEDNSYCMIMEHAEGITLKELIQRTGLIPEARAIKIFGQMLDAVGYAHSKGIIHRDIKPSNVIVGTGDSVKIMDFGIAKILGDKSLTRTGTKMGTVYYMSPEQIRAGKDIDVRTDIYSLGITFYEMLTGKVPFNTETESEFEIMNDIIYKDLPDPRDYYGAISENTVNVITGMTKKDKNSRINSIKECNYLIRNRYSEPTINPSENTIIQESNKNDISPVPVIENVKNDSQEESKTGSKLKIAIPVVMGCILALFLIIYLSQKRNDTGQTISNYSQNSNSDYDSRNSYQNPAQNSAEPEFNINDLLTDATKWQISKKLAFLPSGAPRNLYLQNLLDKLESTDGEGVPVTKDEFISYLNQPEARVVYTDKLIKYATPKSREIQEQEHVDYTQLFMQENRLAAGVDFLKKFNGLLTESGDRYGILPKDIVSILMWESRLGEITGNYQIFNIFISQILLLDIAQQYTISQIKSRGEENPLNDPELQQRETKRLEIRKKSAVKGLTSLLRICKSKGSDPLSQKGSWGGAIGFVQFMPFNLKYAVDGDQDGSIDLSSWPDAIPSVANYLKVVGKYNDTDKGRWRAILRYNPSPEYSNGVIVYADEIWRRYQNN
ncbi:MAG: serine/threonine-protein kinase [Ignavibacteria bacterium]